MKTIKKFNLLKMLNKTPEAEDLGVKSLKNLTDALFGRFSQCSDTEAKQNMAVVILSSY